MAILRTTRPAGWYVRTVVLAFAFMLPVQAVRPMVSYRALEIGASTTELGVVAGSYAALSFAMAIPLGRWIDRAGVPLFLVGGASLVTVAAGALAVSNSLLALAGAQALLGLGQISGLIGVQTLLSNSGAPERRDSRIAAFTVAGASGQMLGPSAAGSLLALSGGNLALVFLTWSAVSVLALVLALSLVARPAPLTEVERFGPAPVQQPLHRGIRTVLGTPSVPHAMLASLSVLTTIDVLIAYLPAYGEAQGIPPETIGLLLGVQSAGALTSRLLMVRLIGRFGRRRVLSASMIVPALVLLALPRLSTPFVMFPVMAVAGFGLGLGQPLSLAWVVSQVPHHIRGTAIGVRLTANRFGQLAVPIGVGSIAGATGIGAVFLTMSGLLGTSAAAIARASDSDA